MPDNLDFKILISSELGPGGTTAIDQHTAALKGGQTAAERLDAATQNLAAKLSTLNERAAKGEGSIDDLSAAYADARGELGEIAIEAAKAGDALTMKSVGSGLREIERAEREILKVQQDINKEAAKAQSEGDGGGTLAGMQRAARSFRGILTDINSLIQISRTAWEGYTALFPEDAKEMEKAFKTAIDGIKLSLGMETEAIAELREPLNNLGKWHRDQVTPVNELKRALEGLKEASKDLDAASSEVAKGRDYDLSKQREQLKRDEEAQLLKIDQGEGTPEEKEARKAKIRAGTKDQMRALDTIGDSNKLSDQVEKEQRAQLDLDQAEQRKKTIEDRIKAADKAENLDAEIERQKQLAQTKQQQAATLGPGLTFLDKAEKADMALATSLGLPHLPSKGFGKMADDLARDASTAAQQLEDLKKRRAAVEMPRDFDREKEQQALALAENDLTGRRSELSAARRATEAESNDFDRREADRQTAAEKERQKRLDEKLGGDAEKGLGTGADSDVERLRKELHDVGQSGDKKAFLAKQKEYNAALAKRQALNQPNTTPDEAIFDENGDDTSWADYVSTKGNEKPAATGGPKGDEKGGSQPGPQAGRNTVNSGGDGMTSSAVLEVLKDILHAIRNTGLGNGGSVAANNATAQTAALSAHVATQMATVQTITSRALSQIRAEAQQFAQAHNRTAQRVLRLESNRNNG